MKCKICGAKLKKDGDICKNCYNEYQDYEKLISDNEQEILSINRAFSIRFNLLKSGEIFLLLLIAIIGSFCYYTIIWAILITIACIAFFVGWMTFCKKRANGTKITFYETKLKYVAKYPLIDREEIIPYRDIKDIAFFQQTSQKFCKIGDIRFYTKGFLNGLTFADMPDIKQNFEQITEIINSTRENVEQ